MISFGLKKNSFIKSFMQVSGIVFTTITLSMSVPLPRTCDHTLEAQVKDYLTTYDTLSTWICQGAVSAPERRKYHDAINEARISLEQRFKTFILEKLNAHEFDTVMNLPTYVDAYLTREKKQSLKKTPIDYLTYPTEALQSLVPTLYAYIDEQVHAHFDRYMHHASFADAFELARLYEVHGDKKRAAAWMTRIRDQATMALELSAQKSVALKEIPALARDESARIHALIHSFPEHHEIRVHLERRLTEVGEGILLVNELNE